MSVEAMTWVLNEAPELPPELFAVLMGYANHASGDGSGAYPSHDTIAKYSRKGVRQVRKDIARLVLLGLLKPGDQRLVSHIRADRRPVVYDLPITLSREVSDDLSSSSGRNPTTGRTGPGGTTRPVVQGHTTCPVDPPNLPEEEPKPKTAPRKAQTPARPRKDGPEGALADAIAKRFHEYVNGVCNFLAVKAVVLKCVKAGATEQAIVTALYELDKAGRPITADTMRQQLAKPHQPTERRPGAAPNRYAEQ